MFVSARVITFKALLRNLMHRSICRLNASKNEIIVGLSNIRVSSTCISQSCADTGTAVFCNSLCLRWILWESVIKD